MATAMRYAIAALCAMAATAALAQYKDSPEQQARKLNPYVYMRDGGGDKIFLETQFWRNDPGYDQKALTRVSEVMSQPVLFIAPERNLEECMVVMTNKRVRHLPVMDHGKLIGIVTIGDVVKAMISEQALRIEQLENYIIGSGYGE